MGTGCVEPAMETSRKSMQTINIAVFVNRGVATRTHIKITLASPCKSHEMCLSESVLVH